MRRAAVRLPNSVLRCQYSQAGRSITCSASAVQLNVYALDTDITRMLSQSCSCYRRLQLANFSAKW